MAGQVPAGWPEPRRGGRGSESDCHAREDDSRWRPLPRLQLGRPASPTRWRPPDILGTTKGTGQARKTNPAEETQASPLHACLPLWDPCLYQVQPSSVVRPPTYVMKFTAVSTRQHCWLPTQQSLPPSSLLPKPSSQSQGMRLDWSKPVPSCQ